MKRIFQYENLAGVWIADSIEGAAKQLSRESASNDIDLNCFTELSAMQAIVDLINDKKGGATDDGYYECETDEEKISYGIRLSGHSDYCLPVVAFEAERVVRNLDNDFDSSSERWQDYEELI